MKHRHLNHSNYSLAAIDSCIARGLLEDWQQLMRAAKQDAQLPIKIRKICEVYVKDPYQQRYHFWLNYVEREFQ